MSLAKSSLHYMTSGAKSECVPINVTAAKLIHSNLRFATYFNDPNQFIHQTENCVLNLFKSGAFLALYLLQKQLWNVESFSIQMMHIVFDG